MPGPEDVKGLPGGAQQTSVGTTPVTIDLSVFVGRRVAVWSNDQNLLFSFSASEASGQTFAAGDQAASLSALIADFAPKGIAVLRRVRVTAPYLVVATDASTATVRVKPVSDKASGE